MPDHVPRPDPEALVLELAELRRLSARAAAAEEPEAQFAKVLFDRLISRLEARLAETAVDCR